MKHTRIWRTCGWVAGVISLIMLIVMATLAISGSHPSPGFNVAAAASVILACAATGLLTATCIVDALRVAEQQRAADYLRWTEQVTDRLGGRMPDNVRSIIN